MRQVKTEMGVITIAGDLFWFSQRENINKGFAEDRTKFKKNREKIIKLSDYIIPGHSKMFKVKK